MRSDRRGGPKRKERISRAGGSRDAPRRGRGRRRGLLRARKGRAWLTSGALASSSARCGGPRFESESGSGAARASRDPPATKTARAPRRLSTPPRDPRDALRTPPSRRTLRRRRPSTSIPRSLRKTRRIISPMSSQEVDRDAASSRHARGRMARGDRRALVAVTARRAALAFASTRPHDRAARLRLRDRARRAASRGGVDARPAYVRPRSSSMPGIARAPRDQATRSRRNRAPGSRRGGSRCPVRGAAATPFGRARAVGIEPAPPVLIAEFALRTRTRLRGGAEPRAARSAAPSGGALRALRTRPTAALFRAQR